MKKFYFVIYSTLSIILISHVYSTNSWSTIWDVDNNGKWSLPDIIYGFQSLVGMKSSNFETVVFSDNNFEAAIRDALSKPVGDIFVSDMLSLTSLDASGRNIKNIEGIRHAINLSHLTLEHKETNGSWNYNAINDISEVSRLTKLSVLYMSYNQISDISAVAGLTNLTALHLISNQISDISPLSGLTKLTSLHLGLNSISDISSLSGLTKLSDLNLVYNQISDISALTGLINLNRIVIWSNQIYSIKPLVDNSGINSGDYIGLTFLEYGVGNPLNTTSCTDYIPQLQDRGVRIDHSCQ